MSGTRRCVTPLRLALRDGCAAHQAHHVRHMIKRVRRSA
ncbi:hypothetical protein MYA_5966 [Burkholderia sp. KJ006]|nr:hypothetical protein MYA_5966 [Burkholderia sp. KJ006]